jgi:hypothetical protein
MGRERGRGQVLGVVIGDQGSEVGGQRLGSKGKIGKNKQEREK